MSKKYYFNFLYCHIKKTRVIELQSIDISWNHLYINLWNLALGLVIKSNYNINFILSNIKALALIYYITNYVIKKNYSKNQYVLDAVFIWNTYNKVI